LDGAPDVETLDNGFAVPILEYAEHSPCEQIDLFPARRCHFTIYKPLSRAKRVGSQDARDGFREQSMFLSPDLDHGLRVRNLGSEPVEAGKSAIKALGDEAWLSLP
jgi:hypothetical protein